MGWNTTCALLHFSYGLTTSIILFVDICLYNLWHQKIREYIMTELAFIINCKGLFIHDKSLLRLINRLQFH